MTHTNGAAKGSRLPVHLLQQIRDGKDGNPDEAVTPDPQSTFLKDFGSRTQGSVAPPTPAKLGKVAETPKVSEPVIQGNAVEVKPSSRPERAENQRDLAEKGRGGKGTQGKQPEDGKAGWSRKTYRLRPDQYTTLAALHALLTSESGRLINVSELAREAFDLLFAKHKNLLARLSAEPVAKAKSEE